MPRQQYLNSIKEACIFAWHTHRVLPSITGAQAVIEGDGGQSTLARIYHNHFGIKASNDWTGRTVTLPTQEWNGSRMVTINGTFRAYDSIEEGFADKASFFTSTPWRKQNYRHVVGERDYKTAAKALKDAGYATDPQYPSKLIRIVEQYNLQAWDEEAFAGGTGSGVKPPKEIRQNTPVKRDRVVGGTITSAGRQDARNRQITVIGDSLGVGTKPYLEQMGWLSDNYSVYGSRQWTHAQNIYDALAQLDTIKAENRLNEYVIFILGTNRGVTDAELKRAVDTCGRGRKILLVDTASEVGHRTKVSEAYRRASQQYENVFHVNWGDTARQYISSWYHADGAGGTRIHMNGTGYKKHAEFITQAVYQVANTNWAEEVPERTPERRNTGLSIDYDDGKYVAKKDEPAIYNPKLNDQFGFQAGSGEPMWIEHVITVNTTDEQEMLKAGIEYLEEHSAPGAQYTVPLKYLPDDISIGDTGQFIDHEFNPPLYIEARVLGITTSETNPQNDSVTIGNVKVLYPQDKTDILALQKRIQETREELLEEYWNKPVEVTVEATNGLILDFAGTHRRNELAPLAEKTIGVANEYTFPVNKPASADSALLIQGEILNNYSDDMAKVFADINAEPNDEPKIPVDEGQNPQGNPKQPTYDIHNVRTLKTQTFDIEYKDESGAILFTDTAHVYQDSTFNVPVMENAMNVRNITFRSKNPIEMKGISYIELNDKVAEKAQSTQLVVRIMQEDIDITNRYTNFVWTRVSNNSHLDNQWNDLNKHKRDSVITLFASDVEGQESTFICRVLDHENELVGSIGATIKIAGEGQSAFEVWKGFTGNYDATMEEYIEAMRGADGKDGIPGKPGKDGKSQYFHTAWAIDPLGGKFSVEPFDGATYMGTAITGSPADPTDYTAYDWVYVKGDPSYTHVAYANRDDQGNIIDFSLTDTERDYKGYLYSHDETPSTNPADYLWELSVFSVNKELENKANQTQVFDILETQSLSLEKVESLTTELNLTKENAIIRHSANYIETIEKLIGSSDSRDEAIRVLEEYTKTIDTYFVFDDAFTIGKSTNRNKVRITNEQLQFLDGETVLAFLSGTYFNAQNISVSGSFEVGMHKVTKEHNQTVWRYIRGR